jgi:hypothetical protein
MVLCLPGTKVDEWQTITDDLPLQKYWSAAACNANGITKVAKVRGSQRYHLKKVQHGAVVGGDVKIHYDKKTVVKADIISATLS